MRPPDRAGRRPRVAAFVVGLSAVSLAACSSDSPAASGDVAGAAEIASTTVAPDPGGVDDTAVATTTTVRPPPEWSVEVEYEITGVAAPGTGAIVQTFDPAPDAVVDPFEELASCSGWRTTLTGYSVLVQDSGDLGLLSVSVSDPVTAPGIYDALVRVEHSGDGLDLVGTATIFDGLQSGEFLALGDDGQRVAGTFACAGTAPPSPLGLGDPADDVLDTVEATALLRRDDHALIVGFAATAAPGWVCEVDGGTPTMVVDGGPEIGSMTGIDLDGATGRLSVVVGGTTFDFPALALLSVASDDSSRAAGTFAADADGVELDGAFRCT